MLCGDSISSPQRGQRNVWLKEYADGSKEAFTVSPLVFDINGGGVMTSPATARFDIDGDGRKDRVHDISSGDGLLVFNADADGASGESGLELFGDFADLDGDGRKDGFRDGFHALAELARKAVEEKVLAPGTLDDGLDNDTSIQDEAVFLRTNGSAGSYEDIRLEPYETP